MSVYWKREVARIFSLSQAAVNAAIPQVLEASLNSAYELIEEVENKIIVYKAIDTADSLAK